MAVLIPRRHATVYNSSFIGNSNHPDFISNIFPEGCKNDLNLKNRYETASKWMKINSTNLYLKYP